MARNWPLSVLSFTLAYAETSRGFPQTKPSRQPVMLNALLIECSSTATSFAHGTDRIDNGLPSKISAPYAASEIMTSRFLRANSTACAKNSGVALAPVGLLG